MGSKKLKLEEQEDRISDLPDVIIQHILSFLPSTKEAIQTGILSKAWRNQWTHVPVLIFNSTGENDENFSQFIDKTLTLHDCSKIKKFHIEYDCETGEESSLLTSKIRFVTTKDVEELVLRIKPEDDEDWYINVYVLPEFLYNNGSLVKLELFQCSFVLNSIINWSRLKELKLECYSILHDSMIEKVVSGCPVLESLELSRCISFNNMVIASKSLKKLIFVYPQSEEESDRLEISCPNLEELSIVRQEDSDNTEWYVLPDPTIGNVLSSSLLIHTLVVPDWCLDKFVIASKSLKKLVLGRIYQTSDFEISSCPQLEELNLYRFLPFIIHRFEDLDSQFRWEKCLTKKIFGQLQNVKLLEIGTWLIKNLSALEAEEDLSYPLLLKCKCLTLDGTKFDEYLPGIIRAIRSSPVLEKLVIKLQLDQIGAVYDCRKKIYSSDSNGTVFRCCSVSNLKIVKIIGISERDDKHILVLKFVEYLLENAKLLEKIVVILLADCGTDFLFDISKTMLTFQRRFPHTTIELLRST